MSLIKNKYEDHITYEKTSDEVITKPSQTQSIREILFRNTNGMSYDNYKTPYYEDQASFTSQSLNVIQDMEPTEKMQYLASLSYKTQQLKAKIQDFETQKAEELKKQEQWNKANNIPLEVEKKSEIEK